jgi:hypothetical protein
MAELLRRGDAAQAAAGGAKADGVDTGEAADGVPLELPADEPRRELENGR